MKMRRVRLMAVLAVGLLVVVGLVAAVVVPVSAQDTTTLLSMFLRDLRNGTVTLTDATGVKYVSLTTNVGVKIAANKSLCWTGTNDDATGSADLCLSRPSPAIISFAATPITFASLGAPSNGAFAYCSDCTIANPCAGSGTGAFAKRLNGAWVCN